jgi:UbiD family decarboxylase
LKPKDLRSFLASVAADPQLKIEEINRPVHKDYELSAIAKHAEASSNPVMIFRSVIGSEMPVVSGLYGCRRRVALALGAATENVIKTISIAWPIPFPRLKLKKLPSRKCEFPAMIST